MLHLPHLVRRLPYPGELPIKLWPVAQRTFKHENYHLDAEEEWESVFPSGYSLGTVPLNITSQQSSLMTVPSLYNELWCLNHLRQIYIDPGWKDDQCKDRKVHRCLNLVRQAILCSADTSLEPVVLVKLSHGTERATTGIDVLHVCRDWTKVREATERRYQQSQGRATEGFN